MHFPFPSNFVTRGSSDPLKSKNKRHGKTISQIRLNILVLLEILLSFSKVSLDVPGRASNSSSLLIDARLLPYMRVSHFIPLIYRK